ncbi:MAG: hypothetical protein JWQ27_602 [Ferruginibacter sp.]|nr:hypothetical protein [Ferruginibacter sp.]
MKKFFIVSMAVFFSANLFAQTLDDVSAMITKKQYAAGKVAVDKVLADPKNADKADAWYFKGRIYNSLSYDSSISKPEKYTLKAAAFDAFKKSQTLDPKDVRMVFEQYNSYIDLYFGLFDLGAGLFNAKDYAPALQSFKKALEVKDYILAKKYTYGDTKLYALDTSLVLNAAITAMQLKQDDEAQSYYKQLTDANVSGKDFEEVYLSVADYYAKKKDAANLQAMLEKGKRLYPDNAYWNELELKTVEATGDKKALYAKYEEMIAKSPTDFNLNYNYAVEIYNTLYGQEAKPADPAAAKAKLSEALKNAIATDKGIDATVLMLNHTFNVAADYSTAASVIKGTKPEDVKKRNELKALANKKMDEAIPYCEAAIKYYESQPTLKTIQKASFQNVLGYMSDMYSAKGDTKKAAEYDKKKAGISLK